MVCSFAERYKDKSQENIEEPLLSSSAAHGTSEPDQRD